MQALSKVLRALRKWSFRLRGHATIYPIQTGRFNSILVELQAEGWKKRSEYSGVDAWIDYGKVVLARDRQKVLFEWDNWTEGSMEGPKGLLIGLAERYQLPLTDAWRWSEYDDDARDA